jgi:hypothetical protein
MTILPHIPVSTLFWGGTGVGTVAALTFASTRDHREMSGGNLGFVAGGAAAAGAGLLGAMRYERTVGPFADRYAVDGAERITRHSVNLDWASKSGRLGAVVSGFGVGAMMTGNFTLL